MCAVLEQVRAAFAVEEPAGPSELFARRTRPDDRSQRKPKCALELGALHRPEPRPDQLSHTGDVWPRRRDPVIDIDFARLDRWSTDPADPDDPLELQQDLGNAVGIRLIDPRLNAAVDAVRPPLPVEESRSPRQLVPIHPRELDMERGSCLSSIRARAVLIFDKIGRTF